jgi:hypothetical protein
VAKIRLSSRDGGNSRRAPVPRAYAPIMPLWEILPSVFRTATALSPPICYRSPIKAKPRQGELCGPTGLLDDINLAG